MAINSSISLLAIQTQNAIKLIDPKTSSILQTIISEIKTTCLTNQNILLCSQKNALTCFDYQGLELWKQHIGGESTIAYTFEYHQLYCFIYSNKDYRIYSQIQEIKSTFDFVAKDISIINHYGPYIIIADDIQNNIYLFLLDDLILMKTKPFKTFSGNKAQINDIIIKNVVASISKDREIIIFDFATSQIIYQTQLDSEPLTIDIDLDYAYIGCINKQIYQIKYNQQSINYTIQPTQQVNKRKLLIGHLTEIRSLKLFYEDGHNYLASCSEDGQLFIWQVEGNQTILTKKIVTLQAQKIYVIRRPIEYQQQSEEQILFKSKRLMQTKPLKKTKYTTNQQLFCKKRIQKVKLTYQVTNQIFKEIKDPQIEQIIEENQKLKQIIHKLL